MASTQPLANLAYCQGGPASIRPGVATITVMTSAAVEAALLAAGVTGTVAVVLSPIIAGVTYDLLNICAQEPPADPGLTQQDVLDALQPQNFITFANAQAKFRQWFLHWYWGVACQCDNVPTPTQPVLVAPPVSTNGGLPSGAAAPCWDTTVAADGVGAVDTGTNTDIFIDWNALFPGTATVQVTPYDTRLTSSTAKVLPQPLPQNLRFHYTGNQASNQYVTWLRVQFYDSSGAQVNSVFVSLDPTTPTWDLNDTIATLPSNVHSALAVLTALRQPTAPAAPFSASCEMAWDCVSTNTPTTPCCPPDPNLDLRLQQILELLNLLISTSTVPGYMKGTQHPALSGSGSLTVHDIVGVQVAITAKPPTRVIEGNPPYIYDMGWLSILTVDGMIEEKRLSRDSQIWLPVSGRLATTVGYFLNSGVTATITELVPGP